MNQETKSAKYAVRHLIPANIRFGRQTLATQLKSLKATNNRAAGIRVQSAAGTSAANLFTPSGPKSSQAGLI